MPDLVGFQDLRSGLRARDISPDSVIFTTEPNFSLFSSASGSVERCSFASDAPDQDSLLTSHLAGPELSEPDPDKPITVHKTILNRKEKTRDGSEAETTEDENLAGDSARSSFSQALKECQDRRMRSEFLLKKADRRRPASLDLNNAAGNVICSASPRFAAMRKPSIARKTSTFPSPGTPNYRHMNAGIQKGWSSERVPSSHRNTNRRSVNAVFLPNPNNGYGRPLPSKWEDAERWILSPMSVDGAARTSSFQQQQRRPKSKSGPLGPPGVAYCHLFSPAVEGGNKLALNSPFSAGVMAVHGSSSSNFIMATEPCMGRSISIHGCTEMLSQPLSLPGQQDEKYDNTEDAGNGISRAVSRRDMATQMSPESSIQSSPRRLSSFSLASPFIQSVPVPELPSVHFSKPQIRDVPIDERVTMTRWSRKNKGKTAQRVCQNADNWTRKAVSVSSSSWEVSADTSQSVSNIQRQEAKIIAWENLQKAKAEAAIRKLEMKLQKKRESSMDKIMNKLRSAQKKAQDMRSSVLANQVNSHQVVRQPQSDRTLSFRRARPISSLSGCFTCPAF